MLLNSSFLLLNHSVMVDIKRNCDSQAQIPHYSSSKGCSSNPVMGSLDKLLWCDLFKSIQGRCIFCSLQVAQTSTTFLMDHLLRKTVVEIKIYTQEQMLMCFYFEFSASQHNVYIIFSNNMLMQQYRQQNVKLKTFDFTFIFQNFKGLKD